MGSTALLEMGNWGRKMVRTIGDMVGVGVWDTLKEVSGGPWDLQSWSSGERRKPDRALG